MRKIAFIFLTISYALYMGACLHMVNVTDWSVIVAFLIIPNCICHYVQQPETQTRLGLIARRQGWQSTGQHAY